MSRVAEGGRNWNYYVILKICQQWEEIVNLIADVFTALEYNVPLRKP